MPPAIEPTSVQQAVLYAFPLAWLSFWFAVVFVANHWRDGQPPIA